MATAIQRHIKQGRRFSTLEEEVFVGLHLAADRLMAPWERTLRERAELSHVQYNVLRILRGAGADGLSAGEVAERLMTRSPDVTRLIDRLEKRDLVKRTRDRADRRAVNIRITEAGRERIAPFDAQSRTMLRGVLSRLGEARLVQLRDVLGEILDLAEAGA